MPPSAVVRMQILKMINGGFAMKRQLLWSAALLLTLAACSQEEILFEEQEPEEQIDEESPIIRPEEESGDESLKVTYIQANGGVETKADINGSGKFSWSVGDQIAVYTTSGYKKSAALTSDRIEVIDGVSAATFSFSGDNYLEDADRTDVAVFPASLVFDGTAVRTGHNDAHTVGEGGTLKITLPGSYTRAQVEGTESPRPMIAINAEGSGLAFKSICALLRITINNIPKDAHSLKITFPGKKVNGEFALSDFVVGTNGVVLPADDPNPGEDTITITDLGINSFTSGLIINVPVPIGGADDKQKYLYVRVAAWDYFMKESIKYEHKINSIDTPIKVDSSAPILWSPVRTAARRVTANLPYFTSNSSIGKKVVFAPGNLQAILMTLPSGDSTSVATKNNPYGSADTWQFAEHQYDALGNSIGNRFGKGKDDSNSGAAVGAPVDSYAWIGASATHDYEKQPAHKYGLIWPSSTSAKSDTDPTNLYHGVSVGTGHPEYLKNSWVEIFNGITYPANTWRLPSKGGGGVTEWQRLVLAREQEYVSAKATIQDGETIIARGLIVFPDTYVQPYGIDVVFSNCGKNEVKNSTVKYEDNVITPDDWVLLENVGGCVFLPVTNSRRRSNGKIYCDYDGDAVYWTDYSSSVTPITKAPIAIALVVSDTSLGSSSNNGTNKTDVNYQKGVIRRSGGSVRMIRDVN